MAAQIEFQLVGNATSAVNAFKQTSDASQSAGKSAESSSVSFANVAKAIGSAYVVKQVVDFGMAAVSAASEARVANNRLTQAFKDAGDASGTAAKHAIEYADALGRQTGIMPDTIKQAQALLTTFHSLTTPAANTVDLFNRATKAAADLSAAGFGDMTSTAKALGKALEDPTKGVTSLSRMGVIFTAQQKEQIKTMMQSGNVLGAQGIIMGQVEGKVGGMAAATATAGSKMSVAWHEVMVSLGTALLPIVGKVVNAFNSLFTWVQQHASWLIPVAAGLLVIVGAVSVLAVAITAFTVVWGVLNAAFIASPIGWIVLGIVAGVAALIAIGYLLYSNWSTVWGFIKGLVMGVWNWITANWPLLLGILTGPIGIAVVMIIKYWSDIKQWAADAWNFIVGLFTTIGNYIAMPFMWAAGVISSAFNTVMGWARTAWSFIVGLFATIGGYIAAPFQWAAGVVNSVFNSFIGFARSAYSGVVGVWNQIIGFFSGIVGGIASAVSGVFNAITRPFIDAFHFIESYVINPLKTVWNGIAHVLNSIKIETPEVKILGHTIVPGFSWTPPWHVPTLAQGGLLTRSGLVYAHAGEVISPAPATATRPPGPLVAIENATFGGDVDLDLFARRLAWQMTTRGI